MARLGAYKVACHWDNYDKCWYVESAYGWRQDYPVRKRR